MTANSPVKTEPEVGPSTPQPSIASRLASYAFTPAQASSSRNPPESRSRRIVEMVIERPRRAGKRRQAGHANGETSTELESQGGHDEPHRPRKQRRRTDHTPDLVKIEPDTTPLRNAGSTKGTPKKSPKTPRPYAGPEVYAHLRHLPDHIKPGLSIVFCGINPGKRSATDGHHFAHPSNKFWKALHMSRITDRRVTPAEDADMPDLYDFGLTNLCDRPTMEMSELSDLEMKLQVPHFTRKVLRYRPLVVCLVGKKIWDIYDGVVSRTAGLPTTIPQSTPESSSSQLSSLITPKTQNVPFNPYIEAMERHSPPYLDTLPAITQTKAQNGVTLLSLGPGITPASTSPTSSRPTLTPAQSPSKSKGKTRPPFDWHAPRLFRLPHEDGYTYFWTTPNTSGLERTPVPEVAEIFRSLKAFAEDLRSGRQSPGTFRDIDIKGVEASAEHLRRDKREARPSPTCQVDRVRTTKQM